MTKDVLIRIVGLQSLGEADGQEPIELVIGGEYYYQNGSHYLRYEEMVEGLTRRPSTILKLVPRVWKSGRKGLSTYIWYSRKRRKM